MAFDTEPPNRRRRGARFHQESLRDTLEFFPGLAFVCDGDKVEEISVSGCHALGFDDPGEVIGTPFTALIDPAPAHHNLLHEVRSTPGAIPVKIRHRTGEAFPAEISGHWARELGANKSVVMVTLDDSPFKLAVDFSLDLICVCEDNQIRYMNDAGLDLLGYNRVQDMMGAEPATLLHPDYRALLDSPASIEETLREKDVFPARLRTAQGNSLDVRMAIQGSQTKPTQLFIQAEDITAQNQTLLAQQRRIEHLEEKVRERARMLALELQQRRDMEVQMRRLATHDGVTGLPIRMLLMDRIESALVWSSKVDTPVGLIALALDRFHAINRDYGCDAGDEVLRTVAERLVATIKPTDTASRLNGAEFVILCQAIEQEDELDAMVERITEAMEKPHTLNDGTKVPLDLNMGIALAPADGTNPSVLLETALGRISSATHKQRMSA